MDFPTAGQAIVALVDVDAKRAILKELLREGQLNCPHCGKAIVFKDYDIIVPYPAVEYTEERGFVAKKQQT